MENAPILSPDPASALSGLSDHELDSVRARRASLRAAGTAVRHALATTGADGRPAGAGTVRAVIVTLSQVWHDHTIDTESPDGVLAQVVSDAPRLAPAVARLRSEHATVAAALEAALRRLEKAIPNGAVERPALEQVLTAVDRHRRDGRELLYHAYQVDLGLGE